VRRCHAPTGTRSADRPARAGCGPISVLANWRIGRRWRRRWFSGIGGGLTNSVAVLRVRGWRSPTDRPPMVMAPVELRGHRQHDGQVRGALMGLRRPFALRFRTDGMLLFIPSCGGATRRQAHGQQTIRGNKATATNRPCLGFASEESHSKRTSTRQQLDCAKTL
jgi:hypothetical protein